MLLSEALPDEKRLPELTSHPPFHLDHWRIEPARLTISEPDGETRLEPRVMALLVTLALADREVVSRSTLLDAVWADVTVGDEALTMAISKLRRALGRQAGGLPFVETIPRVGYRLLVGVSPADDAPGPVPLSSPLADVAASRQVIRPRPGRRLLLILLLAMVALVVSSADRWISPRPTIGPKQPSLPPVHRVVTAYPGLESQATIDPAARRIAFQRQEEGRWSLTVLDLSSHETFPIYEGGLHSPAWSPIDQRIAFIRRHEAAEFLSIVSSTGGAIENLAEITPSRLSGTGWSPDARYLAWSERDQELDSFVIHELDLESREVRRLTAPDAGSLGDGRPAYSPDGRYLAFNRGAHTHLFSYDLWLLDRESGATRRLTHDGQRIWGFDWLPDSSGLVFSSNRSGRFQLWSLTLESSAEPLWIPTAGDKVRFPRLRGNTLVYDAFEVPADLFELSEEGTMTRLDAISSKGRESSPAFSPDGRKLAFGSDRGAAAEIWLREADGRPRRLSHLGASMIFGLAFSPDASHLAASIILKGQPAVAVLDVRSGQGWTLEAPPGRINGVPVFAPDGKSLFVASNASGSYEIWRLGLVSGVRPSQMTDFGARSIRFSCDGARYVLSGAGGDLLLRQDRNAGWRPVLRNFQPFRPFTWNVVRGTVHGLHTGPDGELVWKRWSLETGAAETLAKVPPRLGNGGFAVHPDGRRAVVGRLLAMESDLRMMTLPLVSGNP